MRSDKNTPLSIGLPKAREDFINDAKSQDNDLQNEIEELKNKIWKPINVRFTLKDREKLQMVIDKKKCSLQTFCYNAIMKEISKE